MTRLPCTSRYILHRARPPGLIKLPAVRRALSVSAAARLWTPLTAGVRFPDELEKDEVARKGDSTTKGESGPRLPPKPAEASIRAAIPSREPPRRAVPPINNLSSATSTASKSATPDHVASDLPRFAESQGLTLNSPSSGWQALIDGKIAEARRRGDFDNLKGRGKKLEQETPILGVDNTQYILNRMMKAQDVLPPFLDASHRHTAALADFRTQLRKEWTSPPVSRDKSHRWWSAPDVIEDRKKKIKRINGIAWEHNMALPEKITFRSAWKQDVRLDRELEKVYEEFPPVSK